MLSFVVGSSGRLRWFGRRPLLVCGPAALSLGVGVRFGAAGVRVGAGFCLFGCCFCPRLLRVCEVFFVSCLFLLSGGRWFVLFFSLLRGRPRACFLSFRVGFLSWCVLLSACGFCFFVLGCLFCARLVPCRLSPPPPPLALCLLLCWRCCPLPALASVWLALALSLLSPWCLVWCRVCLLVSWSCLAVLGAVRCAALLVVALWMSLRVRLPGRWVWLCRSFLLPGLAWGPLLVLCVVVLSLALAWPRSACSCLLPAPPPLGRLLLFLLLFLLVCLCLCLALVVSCRVFGRVVSFDFVRSCPFFVRSWGCSW